MFTLFIIILVIWVVIAASKNAKHNKAEDEEALAKLPSFSIRAGRMSSFSKFLNLAYDNSSLLKTFTYSNGQISIVMQNGQMLSGPLSDFYVEFQKSGGMITYTVKNQQGKVSFYQTTNISDDEWTAINGVLCLAGSTYGRDLFSNTYKKLGYINTVQ